LFNIVNVPLDYIGRSISLGQRGMI